MKRLILAALLFVAMFSAAHATIWVSGYSTERGTQVQSYQRSTPSENYTIKGEWKGW